jgi:hypothetical protein
MNIADFNNDGKLDFVAYNPASDNICVGRGNGAGAFGAPLKIVDIFTSQLGTWLVLGDINEDGLMDIVGVDGHYSFQRILSNSIFNYTASIVPLPKGQATAALVDVTGDGRLDLVGVASVFGPQSTPYWSSHEGLGNGSFAPPKDLLLPHSSNRAAVADLNGDGSIDAIIGPDGSPLKYQVALGAGGGDFNLGAPVNVEMGWVSAYTLADVNNDAVLDLIQSEGSGVKAGVKLGDGAGGFGAFNSFYATNDATFVGAADFIGDGNIDIVLSADLFGFIGVLEGDGTGRFVSGSLLSNGGKAATIGDLNQDGWPDIAMNGFSLTLATGSGAGGVNEPQVLATGIDYSRDITNADFNRDGILDLAILNGVAGLSIRLGNGAGVFAAPVNWTSIPNPSHVAAGELNQDGVPDLVISGQNGACALLSMGGGALAPPTLLPYPVAVSNSSVELGDFDGNGLLDFLAGTGAQEKLLFFRATGGGAFAEPVPILTSTTTDFLASSARAVDINQDDCLDLLIANTGDNSVQVSFGDGHGGFGGPTSIGSMSHDLLAAGDLNGDAVPDVISRSGAQMMIRLGTTTGVFSAPHAVNQALGATTGYWITDMSGDGFADIIMAGEAWTLIAPNLRANPAGTESFGHGTPGYRGFLGVMSNQPPFVGNDKFTLTCSNAPRSSMGALLIADVKDPAGNDLFGLGFVLHLDFAGSGTVLAFDMPTDTQGLAAAYVPIPSDPSLVGTSVHAQAFFVDPVVGPSSLSLISSNALTVMFQPQ